MTEDHGVFLQFLAAAHISRPYGDLKFGHSFKTHYYFTARCTRLPRWQDRCYRVSRELCSNYLLFSPIGDPNHFATKAGISAPRVHRIVLSSEVLEYKPERIPAKNAAKNKTYA